MTTDPLAADQKFILRLAHAHRNRALSALLRWNYPTVDRQVIALTQDASRADYLLYAQVGKAFATWHSGKTDVHYGKGGTGLGRAMRQIGRPGGYGPSDPAAVRTIAALLEATTTTRLACALDRTFAHLRGVDHPPHWTTLVADLRDWTNPETRDDVRFRWGQQFYTWTPKQPETV